MKSIFALLILACMFTLGLSAQDSDTIQGQTQVAVQVADSVTTHHVSIDLNQLAEQLIEQYQSRPVSGSGLQSWAGWIIAGLLLLYNATLSWSRTPPKK